MAEMFSRISRAVQRARSNPRVWPRQTTGLSPWKFIRFMGKNTNCKHPVGSPKKGKKIRETRSWKVRIDRPVNDTTLSIWRMRIIISCIYQSLDTRA